MIVVITNPCEENDTPVHAPRRGVIVGATTPPIVNMGDALFHLAWREEKTDAKVATRDAAVEPVMDENEII